MKYLCIIEVIQLDWRIFIFQIKYVMDFIEEI